MELYDSITIGLVRDKSYSKTNQKKEYQQKFQKLELCTNIGEKHGKSGWTIIIKQWV